MTTTDYTAERAKARAWARPYAPGPYKPGHFTLNQRDTVHFDVCAPRRPGYINWFLDVYNPTGIGYPLSEGVMERAFAVRGEPGCLYIRDERWDPERPLRDASRSAGPFASVGEVMTWVMDQLVETEA